MGGGFPFSLIFYHETSDKLSKSVDPTVLMINKNCCVKLPENAELTLKQCIHAFVHVFHRI